MTKISDEITITTIHQHTKKGMQDSFIAFQKQLDKLRTGRASPTLLETIRIEQANVGIVPLQHIATITAADAQTLLVTPWDKSLVKAIEKAIMQSDLGLNPMTTGDTIRVPLPPLSENRRQDFVKLTQQKAEEFRNEVRRYRRDAKNQLNSLLKKKLISEDEERRAQTDIQKFTDQFIHDINQYALEKEKQIMSI